MARALLAQAVLLITATVAAADPGDAMGRRPRGRSCCAFASDLEIHLGTAHMPVALRLISSVAALGHHSYSGWGARQEGDGLLYTVRGGFIDLGHLRDYADLTAFLTVQLRPLLQAGAGIVPLSSLGGRRRVVVTSRPPEAELEETCAAIARRAAFELAVWTEVAQYYGYGDVAGVEEFYSAFTPEDIYSDLLGTYVGSAAVTSARPYDEAVDAELRARLTELGAVDREEARRTMGALAGRWWKRVPWPSPDLAIERSLEIGPRVQPMIPPPDVVPHAPGELLEEPFVLDVPRSDATGRPLADYYLVEVIPDRARLPRAPASVGSSPVTSADLPHLVADIGVAEGMRASSAHPTDRPRASVIPSPLTHYENGLRLFELGALGGLSAPSSSSSAGGVGSGSITAIVGDTRGGDFRLARFDAGHVSERGVVASFSLFRADALYSCRDPETGRRRVPLVSMLGPCAEGEWIGVGGSIGDAFHDGRTGRTGLRPVGGYAVLNLLGNGQSASYERFRLLARGGGAVEHVWAESQGGTTIPRVAGSLLALARTAGGQVEGMLRSSYEVDPGDAHDQGLQTSLTLRWSFLVGGAPSRSRVQDNDPWGVASLGVTGSYAYWGEPLHSLPEEEAPFVSAVQRGTWQLLLTGSLGFEGLSF